MEETKERYLGIVKWFNKKQGYGFINVLTGPHKAKDIFVHYKALRTREHSSGEYKYLVQGEYVEFVIEKTIKDTHEVQAIDITGVLEGFILCDTRQLILQQQNQSHDTAAAAAAEQEPRPVKQQRRRPAVRA